ncbi:MAG TPA: MBL fold metallo-hydrolase [Bacillota bacterium]|nr:MBL fold metallo-hydrolase [Bacillota bacterium]
MNIHHLVTGPLATNTYIVFCQKGGEAVIIDPAGSDQEIIDFIKENNLSVKIILLTHGHADHLGAVKILRQEYSAPVWIHAGDAAMLGNPELNLSAFLGQPLELRPADRLLSNGDVITIDGLILNVSHTPGHTPGGICLIGPGCVFSGDTLFAGSVGRTDFPGGNMDDLIAGIHKHLMILADHIKVFPGHGPQTTIGKERYQNPYLQREGR